jgi:hypothetical protein
VIKQHTTHACFSLPHAPSLREIRYADVGEQKAMRMKEGKRFPSFHITLTTSEALFANPLQLSYLSPYATSGDSSFHFDY